MAGFNTPIPRALQPKFHEGSAMRSVRDADNNSLQWKRNQTSTKQGNADGQGLETLRRQVAQIRRRIVGGFVPTPQTATYFPFEIYKPDNSNIGNGYCFDDAGNPVDCTITSDPTMPTNLPTVLNLGTDAWRVFAVRGGLCSFRPYNYSIVDGGFYGGIYGCESVSPEGVDNISLDYLQFDPTKSVPAIIPIIIPGSVAATDTWYFSIWCQAMQGDSSDDFVSAQIMAIASTDPAITTVFPLPQDSLQVWIGLVTNEGFVLGVNPLPFEIEQFQYGHIDLSPAMTENNLGNGMTPPGLNLNFAINFRGNWDNDLITDKIFYTGDAVLTTQQIERLGIYNQQVWVQTAIGFTDDPSSDDNFFLLSGTVDYTDGTPSPSEPTPNTGE